jgi:Domain of unknown function (DUF4232)
VVAGPAAARIAGSVGPCASSELRMIYKGKQGGNETGENGQFLYFRNVGSSTCSLSGYPGVRLVDRRGVLPLHYRWGGRYVDTHGKARTVHLRPGDLAWFKFARYRCDAGYTAREGRWIQVYAPNTTRPFRRKWHAPYCRAYRGPNSRDPGNTIYIGPVHRYMPQKFSG